MSQKFVYRLNLLVCHNMINEFFSGTYVQKCKLLPLEGDECTITAEWEVQSFQASTFEGRMNRINNDKLDEMYIASQMETHEPWYGCNLNVSQIDIRLVMYCSDNCTPVHVPIVI